MKLSMVGNHKLTDPGDGPCSEGHAKSKYLDQNRSLECPMSQDGDYILWVSPHPSNAASDRPTSLELLLSSPFLHSGASSKWMIIFPVFTEQPFLPDIFAGHPQQF